MLQRIYKLKWLCAGIAAFFCFYVTSPALAAVVLQSGTSIPIELTQEVSSKVNTIGQPVQFRVLKDIVVGSTLAVSAGSVATGEITHVKKAGSVGKNGEISIQVKNIYAVDGKSVSASGTKSVYGDEKQTESIILTILCCILFLILKGESAVLPAGTTVDAVTLGSQSINGKYVGANYHPTVLEPTPIPVSKKKAKKAGKSETIQSTSQSTSQDTGQSTNQKRNKFNR